MGKSRPSSRPETAERRKALGLACHRQLPYFSTEINITSEKLDTAGSHAGGAAQASAPRLRSQQSVVIVQQPDRILVAHENVTQGSNSRGDITSGWRQQRRRKRIALVVIPRGDNPLLLSADMCEERKLLIWAKHIPPVRETWRRLKRGLHDSLASKILRVRNYGVLPHWRIEVIL